MKQVTIGCIGCGNMGGAVARAIGRAIGGSSLLLCDTDESKARAIASACAGAVVMGAEEVARKADFLFLGVKPQAIAAVAASLSGVRKQDAVVVSMAAGIGIRALQDLLGASAKIIRMMPNTPCAVGQGMIQYDCSQTVSDEEEATFVALLGKAGRIDRIGEDKIDAASAVSGCGPAFAYLFAEALADGGVACGLTRAQALTYAAQMMRGAADMLLASPHPGDLKDAVCSPGGTTIVGVHALERGGMRAAVMDAVISAYEKTLALKK